MKKKDIIKLVAKEHEISEKKATSIIDSFFDIFIKEIPNEKLVLPIGTFKVVERKARMGRNPQTKTEMLIPAAKKVKFSATKAFKEYINGESTN